jgi:putative SOS response-associated peptidase YedK
MCGRFVVRAKRSNIVRRFKASEPSDPNLFSAPRYNIAPTQSVAAVRLGDDGRYFSPLRWGLTPSWADDIKIGYKLTNARSETVASKPSFRAAFKARRCLIPASGFYEWKREGKSKQPFFIRPRDEDDLFAFAGLWEMWSDPLGEVVESCTILTTEANELMAPIHNRMPVILDSPAEETWLDPRSSSDALKSLFVPFASEWMAAYAVSTFVNNARNQGPKCLEPAEI